MRRTVFSALTSVAYSVRQIRGVSFYRHASPFYNVPRLLASVFSPSHRFLTLEMKQVTVARQVLIALRNNRVVIHTLLPNFLSRNRKRKQPYLTHR